MDELRENFDAEEVLRALNDGSLEDFLESHYYEREFEARLEATFEMLRIIHSLRLTFVLSGIII